jgi:hypothetical protein
MNGSLGGTVRLALHLQKYPSVEHQFDKIPDERDRVDLSALLEAENSD